MRKLTTEEFIIKARAVHGDRYDYCMSVYKNARTKITVMCHIHGDFHQTPHDHLKGKGCAFCAGKGRIDDLSFKSRAVMVHGDRYDYSYSKYSGASSKICILCKEHGLFWQLPNGHLAGFGCKKCSGLNPITFEEFKYRASDIHGMDRYTYDYIHNFKMTSKMSIRCKVHGCFMQSPKDHLSGHGCPSCAKSGFDKNKDAYVYFLSSGDGVKVGITNNLQARITQLNRSTPFYFDLIKYIEVNGFEAIEIEKSYHCKYESMGKRGFDGATEWLKYSPELMKEIMNN